MIEGIIQKQLLGLSGSKACYIAVQEGDHLAPGALQIRLEGVRCHTLGNVVLCGLFCAAGQL